MAYRIEIKKSAQKEIAGLAKRDQRRVISAIEKLASKPRPPGAQKLRCADDIYRLRVGRYRIIYQIGDRKLTVFVSKVGHRKDVYRQDVYRQL